MPLSGKGNRTLFLHLTFGTMVACGRLFEKEVIHVTTCRHRHLGGNARRDGSCFAHLFGLSRECSSGPVSWDVGMNTLGELEAAVCEGISRFEHDYMGRGPKDIHTHLLGDLLVVRLQGVLTAAERQLVQSLAAEKGRDLLKQVRTHLVETARPVLEAMVQEVTGVKVLSLHHDISTLTGEEVVLFTLVRAPDCRATKKK